MYKISIPKPCFQSWNNMTTSGQGRYCSSCAKTVVDFTRMSDEEVTQYFISNREKQICGHFNNSQLHRIRIDLPANIFKIKLPAWKKFLIAFLVIYGATFFSIDTTIAGSSFSEKYNFISREIVSQGEPVKKAGRFEQKKKKKHTRKRKARYLIMSVTLGGTSAEPLEQVKYTYGIVAIAEPKQQSLTVDSDRETTTVLEDPLTTQPYLKFSNKEKMAKSEVPDNKEPVPKPANPLHDAAFILPAALAPRSASRKKKKA